MGRKRKTHEEFIEEMKQLHPNIEVLGKYTTYTTPIKFRCKNCGREWECEARYMLRKKYSCECLERDDPRALSPELYEKRFHEKANNIVLMTPYQTCRKKVHVKCNTCKYEWDVRPLDFLASGECPKCIGKLKKTTDMFKEELGRINKDIEIIGEYIEANTNIRCKCKICNNEWNARPTNLLHGTGCPICSLEKLKLSEDEFLARLDVINPSIEIIGKYKGRKEHISCKCKICNHIWHTATPHNLLNGSGCPECAKKSISDAKKKTPKEFADELYKVNPNIELLEDYQLSSIKIKCRCKKCKGIWYANPTDILHNESGCPHCRMSKGEEIIKNVLDKENYNYEPQYKFDDCMDKIALRFDFVVFINDKILCVIEYQGIQHYEPIDFAGKGEEWANEMFKSNQRRDKIKRDYCVENNIPLIEIPYWEIKNIENILLDKIKDLTKQRVL